MTKKSILDRISATHDRVNEGFPELWQHALAQALISCLERDKTVSADLIINELKQQAANGKPAVKGKASQEAIKHLRKFI